jgi:hypothetical protein
MPVPVATAVVVSVGTLRMAITVVPALAISTFFRWRKMQAAGAGLPFVIIIASSSCQPRRDGRSQGRSMQQGNIAGD